MKNKHIHRYKNNQIQKANRMVIESNLTHFYVKLPLRGIIYCNFFNYY